MHYERAPRFRRSKLDDGAAFAPLRCAWERSAEGIGKSAGEWHFTLRGKISVGTNALSPKEATAMSRDIKYIGAATMVGG